MERMYNVYAVVDNQPIARQNKKPVPRDKAENLAGRLERGKAHKCQRVHITKA